MSCCIICKRGNQRNLVSFFSDKSWEIRQYLHTLHCESNFYLAVSSNVYLSDTVLPIFPHFMQNWKRWDHLVCTRLVRPTFSTWPMYWQWVFANKEIDYTQNVSTGEMSFSVSQRKYNSINHTAVPLQTFEHFTSQFPLHWFAWQNVRSD